MKFVDINPSLITAVLHHNATCPMPSLHLWRMFPMGLLAGSHNVWATSVNTEIPAHAICLGPASMIPSLETTGDDRSNLYHSSPHQADRKHQAERKHSLTSSIYPEVPPFHRLPPELGHQIGTKGPRTEGVKGQSMSAVPVTVTSSELPSKEAN